MAETTKTSSNNNNNTTKTPTIQQFISPITETYLDSSLLYRLSYQFSRNYKDLATNSTEHFFPTPITHLPTGEERGRYLAVYVGLFYLHVGFIELLGGDDGDANIHHENDVNNTFNGTNGGEAGSRKSKRWFTVRRTLEKAWPIEERLKLEHPVEFFGWIGACIAEVVGDSLRNESLNEEQYPTSRSQSNERRNEYGLDGDHRELVAGISFCFPIVQKSLDEAVLLPTGKGFELNSDLNLRQALLNGYEDHIRPQSPAMETNPWDEEGTNTDIEQQSDNREEQRTTKRRKQFSLPKLKIAAMTNDTVATFASLAYSIKSLRVPNSRVVMGLMVGAGCNATVPMKVSDLHPSKTEFFTRASSSTATAELNADTETLVSTEWTLRRASQPILDMNLLSGWDKKIEASSKPPGFQPMEYIVGGRYMGELVRMIILDYFTDVLRIPTDILPWRLLESGGLTTDFLSLHVASTSSSLGYTNEKVDEDEALAKELNQRLSSAKGWTWNAEKAGILRTVAFAVQSRSAAVIAAATVGLLACTGEIQLKNPDENDDPETSNDKNNNINVSLRLSSQSLPREPVISRSQSPSRYHNQSKTWINGPEELVVAFCGGVIQNYPRYKENLQRHIDRLLVHGGPQKDGKSILLREVNDGGIIGVGVLAGSAMGRIEGIVGSKLNV